MSLRFRFSPPEWFSKIEWCEKNNEIVPNGLSLERDGNKGVFKSKWVYSPLMLFHGLVVRGWREVKRRVSHDIEIWHSYPRGVWLWKVS